MVTDSPGAADAGAALTECYDRLVHENGFQDDPAQREALAKLSALAAQLGDGTTPGPLRRVLARALPLTSRTGTQKGIYLWGSVGRGKTWLMDLFYSELPLQAKRRSHFHDFMRDVHQRLAALGSGTRPLDALATQIARETRVLCLDELTVKDIGDAMILHGLLRGLLDHGVCLVITSNQPPSALYAGGLQRARFEPAIALLERQLTVVQLGGDIDYRLRHLEQAGTYQVGRPAVTEPKMQELFERLSHDPKHRGVGDSARTGGVLTLEGRPIPVRRFASGVGWFGFAALCEGPRSAADYIEIARLLHTVFLSDVPVMDELHDDAARRFIALVDVLYDHDVKLVVAAAAEPRALYSGERLKADFERTISRLEEMRSRDYLGRGHRAAA